MRRPIFTILPLIDGPSISGPWCLAWLPGLAAHEAASVFRIVQGKEWPSSADRFADEEP